MWRGTGIQSDYATLATTTAVIPTAVTPTATTPTATTIHEGQGASGKFNLW